MPEYAEIKITKEFINQETRHIIFNKISFSEKADYLKKNINTSTLKNIPTFKIKAKSRGKELGLFLTSLHGKPLGKFVFQFGMTGNWHLVDKKGFEKLKHVHFWFESKKNYEEYFLAFQDVRRFASCNLWWGENRGPDPIENFKLFSDNIKNNLHKKVFDGRILEVLMNQKYFNGVGNYLRAEILFRAHIDPFLSAREVLTGIKGQTFLHVLKITILEAYSLGGAQLKDWKNPFGKKREEFMSWLQVYGKREKILDKQKRNFWFSKKWKK